MINGVLHLNFVDRARKEEVISDEFTSKSPDSSPTVVLQEEFKSEPIEYDEWSDEKEKKKRKKKKHKRKPFKKQSNSPVVSQ